MTDETLRLPDTAFRAVLDLGLLPLRAPELPARFRDPIIDASFDDETGNCGIYFRWDSGKLHFEWNDFEHQFHFHDTDGNGTEVSPWPAEDTDALLEWAMVFYSHTLPLIPGLIMDVDEAAEWHHLGFTVFAHLCEEPTQLEVIDVTIPGHQFMLPWLGSGHVDHEHDDDDGSIFLVWNPEHDTPLFTIARAWLDPATGRPTSEGGENVDWDSVGLPEAEVRTWLEALYLNDVVIPDASDLILKAALNRIAGIQQP